MMHWERWMTETLQRSGRFVFLRDGLPNFAEHFPGVVFVSEADILGKACSTLPQDLVFVFESQFSSLQSIDSHLQGQRVLIGKKLPQWIEAGWVDVIIPELTQEQWTQALQQSQAFAKQQLPDFRTTQGQPCLFLDRDDVIVKNVPYNNNPDKVELNPGIGQLINKAHAKNWWVALVTNQSGLGRGMVTWEDYQRVHQQMLKLLAAQGCWIDECVWAGHIEEAPHAAGDFYASLRKPRGGMFQLVDEKLKVDRASSVMVGDSASDAIAAYHAGVGHIYLLKTDRMEKEIQKLQGMEKLLPNLRYSSIQSFQEISI